MRNFPRSLQGLLIVLVLCFLVLALSLAVSAEKLASMPQANVDLEAAAFFAQSTATPPAVGDRSEIGSTDGIVIMGVVIVMIVVVPILLRRKSWSDS